MNVVFAGVKYMRLRQKQEEICCCFCSSWCWSIKNQSNRGDDCQPTSKFGLERWFFFLLFCERTWKITDQQPNNRYKKQRHEKFNQIFENVTELINGGLGQQGREDRHTVALINIYSRGWCHWKLVWHCLCVCVKLHAWVSRDRAWSSPCTPTKMHLSLRWWCGERETWRGWWRLSWCWLCWQWWWFLSMRCVFVRQQCKFKVPHIEAQYLNIVER